MCSATLRAFWPTIGKSWAPPRTSWRRVDRRGGRQPRRHQANAARRDHVFQNFVNIYNRRKAALTGALAVTTSPTRFSSCARQCRRHRGWAPSSRRSCACNIMAPIIKNRQYSFLPLGFNPFVGQWRGPTKSPTARTGCGRTTYRRRDRRRRRRSARCRRPTGRCRRRTRFSTSSATGSIPITNPPFVPAKPAAPLPSDPASGLRSMMLPARRKPRRRGRWALSLSIWRRSVAAAPDRRGRGHGFGLRCAPGLPGRQLAAAAGHRGAARGPTRSRRRCPMCRTSRRIPGSS